MNKFVIEARKWFEKANGNTYHSVRITRVDNNELIVHVPCTYGYGEHWKHTAFDELIKLKLVKEADRHNHELNRRRFIYTCADVAFKGDL